MNMKFRLSGAECVDALERLGLEVVHRDDGCAVLRRGDRLVFVPDAVALPSAVIDLVLARADVSLDEVLRVLDDVPTLPDLRCVST